MLPDLPVQTLFERTQFYQELLLHGPVRVSGAGQARDQIAPEPG